MPAGVTQKYYPSIAVLRNTPGPDGEASHQGTAFAIDNNYLLTAGHVCESIQKSQEKGTAGLTVILIEAKADGSPGDKVEGTIAAVDEDRDICLILSLDHPFFLLTLSQNYDIVEAEDPIVVVGAPYAKFPVRSEGHVIQTKAAAWLPVYPEMEPMLIKIDIEGGSSGSPVLWGGEVIGMAVMIPRRPHNCALAVPVTHLIDFVEEHK